MKDTALYEQLLGLESPWSVKHVNLSLADQRVTVEVVLKAGQVWVRIPVNVTADSGNVTGIPANVTEGRYCALLF